MWNKQDRNEIQPDRRAGEVNPFTQFTASDAAEKARKEARQKKYRKIVIAECILIVFLCAVLTMLIIMLLRVNRQNSSQETAAAQPAEWETPEEVIPEAEEESSEEQIWYPAEYASESSIDIMLSRNDMKMLPSGSILREEQIDREMMDHYFFAEEVAPGDDIFSRISGKSVSAADLEHLPELSYLKLLHYNRDGNIQIGELLCETADAEALLNAFEALYEIKYPIAKMNLLENYWETDAAQAMQASEEDYNTAVFDIYHTKLRFAPEKEMTDGDEAYRIFAAQGFSLKADENGRQYFTVGE